MAPSTRDILKQTGLTDAQIDAMDANVLKGFDTVLSTAATAETAAQAAQADAAEKLRLQQQLYENDIVPALNNWGTEKATLEAERDFYRTQAQGAKTAGFIPKEAPGYKPPENRDPGNGQYTAGGNPVPGSPGFTAAQGLEAISNATWYSQEHMRLYGTPPADDFMTLVTEATQNRRPFKEYVEIKYKFGEKRNEIAATKAKEHDDAIRKEVAAAKDKEWAEKVGNNPMVRQGVPSQYDKISAATKAGQLKDPLTLSPEQRRGQTRQAIATEMASQGNA